MGKALVRLTVTITSLYIVASYIMAQFHSIDILTTWYSLLFELCVVLYCYSEGEYHCRFIKSCALSIFVCDLITQLDNWLNFIDATIFNLILIAIMALGIAISITRAFIHFYRVIRIKRAKHGLKRTIAD